MSAAGPVHAIDFVPSRSPRWRAERALELADKGLSPSRKRDDRFVAEYRRFLVAWRRLDSEVARRAMFAKRPAIFGAHSIYHGSDREWRWLIEACILARMDDVEIAKECNTLPEIVGYYEKLFFDVRPYLDSELWVVKHALGYLATPGARLRDGSLAPSRKGALWRLLGYYGGPHVLKAVVTGFRGVDHVEKADVEKWLDSSARFGMKRQALLATHALEANKYNVVQILELHAKLVEAGEEAARTGDEAKWMSNVKAFLDNFKFQMPSAVPSDDVPLSELSNRTEEPHP